MELGLQEPGKTCDDCRWKVTQHDCPHDYLYENTDYAEDCIDFQNKEEIINFELDNWFCGRDYPNAEPFIDWMGKDYGFCFANDEWCKENKLCVKAGYIDMSICFCISAPKSWVEKNCPKLLTDEECGATFHVSYFDPKKGECVEEDKYEPCQYSKFVCKDGIGKISGWSFFEYEEENFGVHWYDEIDDVYLEDEDDEDE